jgi:serine/threonine-protein kinase
MAAVFAAETPTGERVAVKMLHEHMHRRLDIRRRFIREGDTANRIQHDGIVKIIEHSKEGDREAILVMELLKGQSFSDVLRQRASLTTTDVLDVLDQVLDALSVAHGLGIIHRDLKPDNLWLTAEGRVKILDFGIARVLDGIPQDQRTKTGITLGTVPFMSPEQALGKPEGVDARTDLFALGAMAFRILAGRPVHQADTDAGMLVAMATQPAPPLCSVAPNIPKEIGAIVDRALAFSKEERYASARAMQEDVRAVQRGQVPQALSAPLVRAPADAKTRADAPATASPAPNPVAASAVPTSVAPSLNAPTRVDAAPSPTKAVTSVAPAYDAATRVDQASTPPASMPDDPHSARTAVGPGPNQATTVGEAAAVSVVTEGATNAVTSGASTSAAPSPSTRSKKPLLLVALAALLCGGGLVFALSGSAEDGSVAPIEPIFGAEASGAGAEKSTATATSDHPAPGVSDEEGTKATASAAQDTTAPASKKAGASDAPQGAANQAPTSDDTKTAALVGKEPVAPTEVGPEDEAKKVQAPAGKVEDSPATSPSATSTASKPATTPTEKAATAAEDPATSRGKAEAKKVKDRGKGKNKRK